MEAAEWLERCVVAALAKIELNAAFLVKNEKELRRWRLEPDEPSKSAERRFIWERFLKFWSDLGRPVGYSEDGPIIRALRIIHESLEIPAPKGEAIRQVINDFKGRPRASKKKAGKGKHI